MTRTIKFGSQTFEVPWSFMDRMLERLAPVTAMERLQARVKMQAASGGYVGGRRDRRATRNWRPRETSANEALSPDLPDLRARSRDLVRNTPIATGALATVVTSTVGDGLVLKSQVDRAVLGLTPEQAEAWQNKAQREFALWAERPDFTSRLNFDEMQEQVFRATLESGDVFVARRRRVGTGDVYGLKLQVIEADRIGNPTGQANTATLVDGVEMDSDGRPSHYHIATRHPDDTIAVRREWKRYQIHSDSDGTPLILHLYKQQRPDQARGLPYLAPVVEPIKQLGDYTEAEIRAAVLSAMLTVFITSDAPSDAGGNPIIGKSGGDSSADKGEIELGTGATVNLLPGEKVEAYDPKRPNVAFDAFTLAMAKQIGVALELPVELLLKSFTASYSASRAALEMAWQMFRSRRSWLAWKFCQPVYEWVITEAVASGRIDAPGFFRDPLVRMAWLGSDWIGPARIQLDPLKEANADRVDVEMGTKTLEQVCFERTGGSFEGKHQQRAREKAMRDEAGLTQLQPGQGALAPPPTSREDET